MLAIYLKYSLIVYDMEVRFTRINRQLEYRVDVLVSSRIPASMTLKEPVWGLTKLSDYFIKTVPEELGRSVIDCIDASIENQYKVRGVLDWDIEEVIKELNS